MDVIGEPLGRVDGKLKVAGGAQYSAEFQMPGIAYAVMVTSTIPHGRISRIDIAGARKLPGVIAILTPANAPRLSGAQSRLTVLQNDEVFYNNQPIAVVIAESLHEARQAASAVRVSYVPAPAKLDFEAGFRDARPGSHIGLPGDVSFGDVDAGLRHAEIKIEQVYTTPIQHHNPMEPHATIAEWEGDHVTLHDATQHISGVRDTVAEAFGIPQENVHVISLYVGGGFGCKGETWSHVVLAAMAARQVKRPVKLVLERPQMFGPVGARPRTHQRITLGATRTGKLTAIRHEVHSHTSVLEDYLESSAFPTRIMYACPAVSTTHRIVPLNLGTPTYMRAPGVATGTYALEVAMDELAYAIKVDPLQLRLLNYAEIDPQRHKPFTSKNLRSCYLRGAERFGWAARKPEPRSMRIGSELVGWGMATETYPARRMPAAAIVRLEPDGRVLVGSGTQEIGNGVYTVMTQVASDVLSIPPSRIVAKVGDTDPPDGPISAGSMTTASVGPAVKAAAEQARAKLLKMAIADPGSPVHGAEIAEVIFNNGNISLKSSPSKVEPYTAMLARRANGSVEAIAHLDSNMNSEDYSAHSFGAIFAEVTVDPDLGIVRVHRVVAVYDVGKIVNEKLAKSQFIGGIVWGISLALLEDTQVDPLSGRIVNANLADYHVPVNADIGEIDVSALDIPDYQVDSLGVRGIGEIGITGTGAAVANAIFHATGKRIRDLPITPDKLL